MKSILRKVVKGFTRKACVFHMVQPYFFAHHHCHRRKIEVLRRAGFQAWCISFVEKEMYDANRDRYRSFVSDGFTKVVVVSGRNTLSLAVYWFFFSRLLIHSRIVVHVLRCDPNAVLQLRSLPLIGKRIRLVLEYEGHQPSELIYERSCVSSARPPETPTGCTKREYELLLEKQKMEVRSADLLVVMSIEHGELWQSLLRRPVNYIALPTLPTPGRIKFSQNSRNEIRAALCCGDRTVFVYCGNVVCKWQRFADMCLFMKGLEATRGNVYFLAVVRKDDLQLANDLVVGAGLEEVSTIISVREDEVSNYLSAADVALFLRHNHTMNTVVTSAKLGEYLSAGLPVVTTGANAQVLSEFISENNAGAFIADTLDITPEVQKSIDELLLKYRSEDSRLQLGEAFDEKFTNDLDYFGNYVCRMQDLIR